MSFKTVYLYYVYVSSVSAVQDSDVCFPSLTFINDVKERVRPILKTFIHFQSPISELNSTLLFGGFGIIIR